MSVTAVGESIPATPRKMTDPVRAASSPKATYRRTIDGAPRGGGRVTELTSKPLLHMFVPELSVISQPLGGEYALRRDVD